MNASTIRPAAPAACAHAATDRPASAPTAPEGARTLAADRNGWIDCLRGAAAVAVALFHFNAVVPAPAMTAAGRWWGALLGHGALGVAVFFVLSGYCITATWINATDARAFVARRLRRIMPAYWASVALVGLVAVAAKLLRGVNDVAAFPLSPGGIAATLVLATQPATTVPTVNWVYWSLTCEMVFYALAAALLIAGSAAARPWRLAVLHGILCAATLAPALPATGPCFFVRFWPLFGLGAALALRRRHAAAGNAMLLTSGLQLLGTWLRHGPSDTWLLTAAATALLLAPLLRRPLPAGLRPLAWLGGISYSIYLIHVPFGLFVLLRFLAPGEMSLGAHALTQAAWLGAVVLAAWLFWHAFERPFLRPRRSPAPSFPAR